MSVTVYYSSTCGNLKIKKQQQNICSILEGKGIQYQPVDISANSDDKQKMRLIVGDPKALPPQICNNDVYCGDFEAFQNAVEQELLNTFLKL